MSSGEPGGRTSFAQQLLAAFQNEDLEAFLSMLDPDVEIFSTPELANSGRFSGREGYLEWTSHWFDVWEDFEVEPAALEEVGHHHLVMPVTQRGKGKGSGVEVEMRACYMVEVHADRATRFHLYATREQALSAAGEGET